MVFAGMRNGARSRLLAALSPRMLTRISVDLGCGVGIAVATTEFTRTDGTSILLTVLLGLVIAFAAFAFMYTIGGSSASGSWKAQSYRFGLSCVSPVDP